jgi:hypothetical protein
MEEQNDTFQWWQELGTEGVDQRAHDGDGHGKECTMPPLKSINPARRVRIVEDEQTLDQCAAEEADAGECGLPADYRQPSYLRHQPADAKIFPEQ